MNKRIPILIILLFTIHCCLKIQTIIPLFLNYTSIFIQNVFPTSFLFLLVSFLLIEYQFIEFFQKITHFKTYRLYFFIMGLFSGFPACILPIKEALINENISGEEANHYIMFSHFPNPFFILYTVRSIVKERTLTLYGIYIISNLLILLNFG